MVTHEPEIAAHTQRILHTATENCIQMKRTATITPVAFSPVVMQTAEDLRSEMNYREKIRTAWNSILSYKLRSILTMLGVIIGVAAVS
jgi:macrolide transport system ATP-binding/permease protein